MTNWQILPMFARPIAITKIDDEKTKAVQKLASNTFYTSTLYKYHNDEKHE